MISSHNGPISDDFSAEMQQAAANAGLAEAATQPTFGLEVALGTENPMKVRKFRFPHRRLVERDFDRGHPLV